MRLATPPVIPLLFLLLLLDSAKSDVEETCAADSKDVKCSAKGKWTKYLDQIEETLAKYKPCESQDCSCYEEQIQSDLEPFSGGITKDVIVQAKKKFSRIAHYQIINQRLFRTPDCMFEPRCKGIDHFLLEILPNLPDMEFLLNDRDHPQVNRHFPETFPIFSFSKTNSYLDIMYPAWSFWAGGPAISLHPTGIGRWDQLRDKINRAGKNYPWTRKESKAFFRGSRTSAERDPLVLLSRAKPQLADAQYTKNQAWKSDKDTLGAEPAKEVTFEDHCKYKYLFNFRGVAASFRFKHLFLCQSLVFHVGEEWDEFFYAQLKPWVHYIPLSTDLDNLEETLNFARENDGVVRQIAKRGYEFIWKHLRPEDVSCYWRKLLSQYSTLIRYKIKRDPTLKSIV